MAYKFQTCYFILFILYVTNFSNLVCCKLFYKNAFEEKDNEVHPQTKGEIKSTRIEVEGLDFGSFLQEDDNIYHSSPIYKSLLSKFYIPKRGS